MKRIFFIALFTASLSQAAAIHYTFSGTFSESTPLSALTAPDTPFTLTFEVDETPVPTGFLTGIRTEFLSPVTLAFGANLLTFPSLAFAFYGAPSDGGFSVAGLTSGGDSLYFSTASEQLYTGSEQFPVMRTGVFNVPVGPISGIDLSLASGSTEPYYFPQEGTITGTTSAPEPSTGVLACGVLGLLLFARLRQSQMRPNPWRVTARK